MKFPFHHNQNADLGKLQANKKEGKVNFFYNTYHNYELENHNISIKLADFLNILNSMSPTLKLKMESERSRLSFWTL